ncbi:MAG TPA: SDR family oxidoreductase [Caulobacteraceae bacterium]|jgi:short-subunit dehydrogenase|nr:SDR family oxidoreductase [Caulobacteraceae bacterium]
MSAPSGRRLCLVTGASAGIGAAFARTYAAHGYDLALTARRAERLEMLAASLRNDFGIEVLVLPGDLALPETPERLTTELAARGCTVDALVNNAGYGLRGDHGVHPWTEHQAFLQVMVAAPAALAHLVLPGMVERGFGRIVNVASLMGLMPAPPSQGLYSPAKAFLVKFSEGLHLETRGTGVHVTALCPGLTRSEFHQVAAMTKTVASAPPWMWLEARDVAQAGYAAAEANRPICVPGGVNKALAVLARALPEQLGMRLMARQVGR